MASYQYILELEDSNGKAYNQSAYLFHNYISAFKLSSRVVQTLIRKGHQGEPHFQLMVRLLAQVIFNDPTRNCCVKGSRADRDGLPRRKSLYYTAPLWPASRLATSRFGNKNEGKTLPKP